MPSGARRFRPTSSWRWRPTGWRNGAGVERFEGAQPPYSILARGVELHGSARLPALRHGGHRVEPAQRRVAHGALPQERAHARRWGRASRVPDRFTPSLSEVMAKLEAIEGLVDVANKAEVTLAHMALAFTLTHPAVTSAIIGPRTMEHMTGALGALEVSLSDETLDRIDAVVAPGTTVDPSDTGWTLPHVADSWRRRRPLATRAGTR